MQVATDHKIIPFGNDRLDLCDSNSGELIAQATREEGRVVWTVKADGVLDMLAANTQEAITMLTQQALIKLRGTVDGPGFSTWAPNEVTMRDD